MGKIYYKGQEYTTSVNNEKIEAVLGFVPANSADIPTKLSDLQEDETHQTVTQAEKNKWNTTIKSFSGSYNDLDDLPPFKAVATSGSYADLSGTPELKAVATSGSYTDLSNTPKGNIVDLNYTWDESTGTLTFQET